MALYKWPTGPSKRHTIPYATHQANVRARAAPKPKLPVKPKPLVRPVAPRPVVPRPAPVAPVPRPPVAAPPDPTYENEVAGLARTRDDTLGQIGAQRTQQLAGYGYTEGAGGALAFDPNNPFSKAALLKRTYDQRRRSTGGQMAAGGQLYAGAYQSGQDVVNRGQLQDTDVLQQNLQQFLARNTGQRGEAQTAYESGVSQAEANRLARLEELENPLYEPETDLPAPKAGFSKPKPKPKPKPAPKKPAPPPKKKKK